MTQARPSSLDPPEMTTVAPELAGMRVLAFCDYYGATTYAGSDRVAAEIYKRMVAWGAEVTVVSADVTPSATDLTVDGVRVLVHRGHDLSRVLRAQVMGAPGLYAHALRVARELRPAVLHANGLHFRTTLAAARVQRRLGVPLVTTAHIGALDGLDAATRMATGLYEHTLGRFVLARSMSTIAVSHSVADHLRVLRPTADAVVVANGVDRGTYSPRVGTRPRGAPRFVFVGRLIANKGPELFVEALARLHAGEVDFTAVIVGDGPLRSALEAGVAKAGLGQIVRFVGHVSNVAEYLRNADILVRPSTTEGMPLAVLESMACGLCVVATDIPGNAELIKHGVNGLLVPVGDLEALVDQLRSVAVDSERRDLLAAAGYKVAMSHSWEACAADTARVLMAAIHAPGRRPPPLSALALGRRRLEESRNRPL